MSDPKTDAKQRLEVIRASALGLPSTLEQRQALDRISHRSVGNMNPAPTVPMRLPGYLNSAPVSVPIEPGPKKAGAKKLESKPKTDAAHRREVVEGAAIGMPSTLEQRQALDRFQKHVAPPAVPMRLPGYLNSAPVSVPAAPAPMPAGPAPMPVLRQGPAPREMFSARPSPMATRSARPMAAGVLAQRAPMPAPGEVLVIDTNAPPGTGKIEKDVWTKRRADPHNPRFRKAMSDAQKVVDKMYERASLIEMLERAPFVPAPVLQAVRTKPL